MNQKVSIEKQINLKKTRKGILFLIRITSFMLALAWQIYEFTMCTMVCILCNLCRVMPIILCAIVIFLISMGFIMDRYDYVVLSNGMRLSADKWFKSGYGPNILKDKEGRTIAGRDVCKIVWNDGYVMGYHNGIQFVYKLGLPEAIYKGDPSFNELVEESGLGGKKNHEYKGFRCLRYSDCPEPGVDLLC